MRLWMREWRIKNPEKYKRNWQKTQAKRKALGLIKPSDPAYQRMWRLKNKDAVNERERAYAKAHPEQWRRDIRNLRSTLAGTIKYLCKKRNRKHLEDTLVNQFYFQYGRCAISNVIMTWGRAGEGRIPTHISIDRIDSSKGYTTDNVQLVCCVVNRMKSNMTHNELSYWCKNIVENAE